MTGPAVTVPGASVGGVCAGGASDASGFGGAAVASSEARIREMGGKTLRLVFGSASSVFFRDFFRSINETLSTSWGRAGAVRGSDSCGGVTADLPAAVVAALPRETSLFTSFFGTFDLGAAADLSAAVVLRSAAWAAGLRLAVLLLVFVAIVIRSKFRSWLKRP